jgi:hypothetical protein
MAGEKLRDAILQRMEVLEKRTIEVVNLNTHGNYWEFLGYTPRIDQNEFIAKTACKKIEFTRGRDVDYYEAEPDGSSKRHSEYGMIFKVEMSEHSSIEIGYSSHIKRVRITPSGCNTFDLGDKDSQYDDGRYGLLVCHVELESMLQKLIEAFDFIMGLLDAEEQKYRQAYHQYPMGDPEAVEKLEEIENNLLKVFS